MSKEKITSLSLFSQLQARCPAQQSSEKARPDCSINKNAVGAAIWLQVQAWGDDCSILIETQWQETLCFKDSISCPQVLQINILAQFPLQLQTASLGLLHPCFSSPALLEHWLSLYFCPAWKRTQIQALLWQMNTRKLNISFCKCVWPGSSTADGATLFRSSSSTEQPQKTLLSREVNIISLKTKNPLHYH